MRGSRDGSAGRGEAGPNTSGAGRTPRRRRTGPAGACQAGKAKWEAERFLIHTDKGFGGGASPFLRTLVRSKRPGILATEIAGNKYIYAPLRRLDFLASAPCLLVVSRPMDLMRERRNGGGSEERKGPRPANDNGSRSDQSLDPRILRIAETIGRQLAREQAPRPAAANDNKPRPRSGQLLRLQYHLLGSFALVSGSPRISA